MSLNKNFFIGLFIGAALSMVTLDIWRRYLERSIINGAEGIDMNASPLYLGT